MANIIPEPKKNRFGPLRVLLRTDGTYIVYDARLPPGNRTIFLTDTFESAREHAVAISGIAEGVDSTKDDE